MIFARTQADRARVAQRSSRAFTLIELLVVIAIIAIIVAIVLPGLASARRSAKQSKNLSNIRQIGVSMMAYGSDFRDLIASFSAQPGFVPKDPTLAAFGQVNAPLYATALQAFDILVARTGWLPLNPSKWVTTWIPHPTYTHFVLADYAAGRIPEAAFISPMDRYRLGFQGNAVAAAEQMDKSPAASIAGSEPARPMWPFSSSYLFTPASFTPDKYSGSESFGLTQGGSQPYYFGGSLLDPRVPGDPSPRFRYALGGRKLTDVAFPAQKVVLYEDAGRFQANIEYPFTHTLAKTTNMMFDGSARVVGNSEINPGGYLVELLARNGSVSGYKVVPATITWDDAFSVWGYATWPSQVPAGDPTRTQPARQRWTVGGLKGVDFGGGEVKP